MPLLNFDRLFATLVEDGYKRQTIRPMRRRPFRANDTLCLYTGLRTRHCRKLGEAKCLSVATITLVCNAGADALHEPLCVTVDGVRLSPVGVWAMARDEAFLNEVEMMQWFERTYGLPFSGQVIRW